MKRKGVTLIELMIVVAMIAIIIAIAVPLIRGDAPKNKGEGKKDNIREVREKWSDCQELVDKLIKGEK